MLGWLFRKRAEPEVETRSLVHTGFTGQVLAARQAYVSGVSGLGELTATVQACVSLWEGALASADVVGTDLLDRRTMAVLARSLALRGEFVALVRDRLVPCSDWDLSTRDGAPRVYRVTVPEVGGGRSETALAGEVLHVRLAADATAPWTGQAPLRRASLSAQLLHELESAVHGVFRDAPLGSMIVPLDAGGGEALEQVRGSLRGRRGGALVVEYLSTAIAGGAPVPGRGPDHLSPDLRNSMTVEHLEQARGAILMAFGVLPAMLNPAATGPVIREGQRHLCQWMLEPIAKLIAEEATAKLGAPVEIDVARPLVAYDAGGKARAVSAIVGALAQAKEAGIDPAPALAMVDWRES